MFNKFSSPAINDKVVVLPELDSATSALTYPSSSVKSTFLRAKLYFPNAYVIGVLTFSFDFFILNATERFLMVIDGFPGFNDLIFFQNSGLKKKKLGSPRYPFSETVYEYHN